MFAFITEYLARQIVHLPLIYRAANLVDGLPMRLLPAINGDGSAYHDIDNCSDVERTAAIDDPLPNLGITLKDGAEITCIKVGVVWSLEWHMPK